MQSPLISVIIPAFNASTCIREAFVSLLQQKFTAFEILVIDGASKDNTVDILNEYAALDKRVRFISEKDEGIYDAMNKGIRLATGEWLYFLGADDTLYDEHVLGSVAPVLQKANTGFVYGNVLMGKHQHRYDGPFTYEKLLRKNISHQAIFYNRKVFSLVGEFNLRYKTHADWAFNISCFHQAALTKQYINVLIARFSIGGASSQYDVLFQREFLLPVRLSYLQQTGMGTLKHISMYDDWWRFFRNSDIRSQEQLGGYCKELPVPAVLVNMVKFQSRVSPALLKKGPVSKCLMFLHYIFNRIINICRYTLKYFKRR